LVYKLLLGEAGWQLIAKKYYIFRSTTLKNADKVGF